MSQKWGGFRPPPTGGFYQPRHQPQFAPQGLPPPGSHQPGPGPRPSPCFQPPHVPSTLTSAKQVSTQTHTKGNSLTERRQWKKLRRLHDKMNPRMSKNTPHVSYDKIFRMTAAYLKGMRRSHSRKQKKELKRKRRRERKNLKKEREAGGISGQQGNQGPGAKRPVPMAKLDTVEGREQRNYNLTKKVQQMLHEVEPASGGEMEITQLKHNIELLDRRINNLLIKRNGQKNPSVKCGMCKNNGQRGPPIKVDSVMTYLSHCSSKTHGRKLQQAAEQWREVPTDFWNLTPGPQEQQGDFAGNEFVMPCKALYCRLCGQFATNAGCMYMHLRTTAHVNLYKAEFDGSSTSQLSKAAPNIWRRMPK